MVDDGAVDALSTGFAPADETGWAALLAVDVPGFFAADCKLENRPDGFATTCLGLTAVAVGPAIGFELSLASVAFFKVLLALADVGTPLALPATVASFF